MDTQIKYLGFLKHKTYTATYLQSLLPYLGNTIAIKIDFARDRDFEKVVFLCATVARPNQEGSWIDRTFFEAYTRLHYESYISHCVSVYRGGALCGGLYGVTLGGVFFGESMFFLQANASKVALVHLCRRLAELGFLMIDCQQVTPHILSMGAVELSRTVYLKLLQEGLQAPHHHYRWPDS